MVVADASPLIVLAKLRRLWLPRDLYEVLWLSPAVVAEILRVARETDS